MIGKEVRETTRVCLVSPKTVSDFWWRFEKHTNYGHFEFFFLYEMNFIRKTKNMREIYTFFLIRNKPTWKQLKYLNS